MLPSVIAGATPMASCTSGGRSSPTSANTIKVSAPDNGNGIVIDASSDVPGRASRGRGQAQYLNARDVRDDGTNNCWKHDTYDTGIVPECP